MPVHPLGFFTFATRFFPMLTDTFLKLVSKYTPNTELANHLWLEIVNKYSDSKRQYHNLTHLENMLKDLDPLREKLIDWESTYFALYYHDLIYKAGNNANEEESAKAARARLTEIGYPGERIQDVANLIGATKTHGLSEDPDTNLLTDADLSILGQDAETYRKYASAIREEYSLYPDFMYNSGRRKALQQFLDMPRIFKTDHFFEKYEKQARSNIAEELENL